MAAEFPRQIVEIGADFVAAAPHDQGEGGGILLHFGNFDGGGFEDGLELGERFGFDAAARAEAIKDAFTLAAVLEQAALFHLRQVRGDAALAHAEDILQLGDR